MTAEHRTPAAATLQSVMPLGAVPDRLRGAVARAVEPWGYGWGDISFAGTAQLPPDQHSRLGPSFDEVWVFAVAVGTLEIGDELEAAGSRTTGVSLSAFSGGVIPVTPFQARVYEYLGPRGGKAPPPRDPSPMPAATTPDTGSAAPDRRR